MYFAKREAIGTDKFRPSETLLRWGQWRLPQEKS
jgi:hypothetical protein